MLKLSETDTLKRFVIPPGDPPKSSITPFPSSPLDLPAETFVNSLNRREQNRKTLLKWIQENLQPDIHYGRVHLDQRCQYAKAGIPDRCSTFSHWSRPMLFKGGAELIINVLGLTACYPNLFQYELACVHKQEISRVILKCELKTSNGTIVAEGSSARHIRDEGWNLNKAIKMAAKSAMIEATIRVSGLTGVFIKTHRHTLKNNLPAMTKYPDNLTPQGNCNSNGPHYIQQEKPITQRQKDLIQRIAGRKGMTTESLERFIQEQFNKHLDNLTRVEASKCIQHLNG